MNFIKKLFYSEPSADREKRRTTSSSSCHSCEPYASFISSISEDDGNVSDVKFIQHLHETIPDDKLLNCIWSKICGPVFRESLSSTFVASWCDQMLSLEHEISQLDYYIGLLTSPEGFIHIESVMYLFKIALFFMLKHFTQPEILSNWEILQAVHISLANKFGDANIHKNDVCSWFDSHCASIYGGLHTFLMNVILDNKYKKNSSFDQSVLQKLSRSLLSLPLCSVLVCVLPHPYVAAFSTAPLEGNIEPYLTNVKLSYPLILQPWTLLYGSDVHGLSLNRFANHVFSYKGPTVIFVAAGGNQNFIIGCDMEWRESMKPFGGEDSIIIQTNPDYKMIQRGSNMFLYNTVNRTIAKGIQIGKDPRLRILSIDEDMFKISIYGLQTKLVALEVWGCGGLRFLEEQEKQKIWEKQQVKKSLDRKLRLTGEGGWDDNPDKHILRMGGIAVDRNREQLHNPNTQD